MKTTNKILLGLLIVCMLAITVFMVIIRVQLKSAVFVEPSGNVITSRVEMPVFHGIDASGKLNMIIRQGNNHDVIIRADDNLMEMIRTDVKDEILNVSFRGWSGKNATIEVEVNLAEIELLKAMAGVKIHSEGTISGHSLRHVVNAGAESRLEIQFDFLELELNGGGNANLRGFVREMKARNNAGGTIEASGLETEKLSISANAGSVSHVFVTGELDVKASTGSVVNYTGDPLVKNITSGSGASVNAR